MPESAKYSLEAAVRQSPPIDQSGTVNDEWVRGKTILITGGASGFGAGFFRRWAAAGANVIIGDINVEKGDQLVRDVKTETGNRDLHFFHVDVTDWQSQVQFFKDVVKVSPHGGIDTVVASAGIVDRNLNIEMPEGLDALSPPPPNLEVLNVNLTGVLYTVHLALFWLARNPESCPSSPASNPAMVRRDRHLLLLSSMAGIMPIPYQTLYATSKHGVVGLYRTLRCSSFMHGVRTNLICPYFIDTPMFTATARLLTAGGATGKLEDVVEAATRFVADPRIVGRAVVVGPKLKIDTGNEDWSLIKKLNQDAEEKAIWEVYVHDWEESEVFSRNIVRMLNQVVELRGWYGWLRDIFAAVRYKLIGER